MQKLMKNWIFTLVVCCLLSILAVLMILDGFGVGDVYLGRQILHILAAVVLSLYLIFGLFPLLKTYRGTVQAFLIAEIAILLIAAVAQACQQFFRIPILAEMQVCAILGLALWLRGAVKTVHAYLLNGAADAKRIPLWQLCCYIVLSAVGVWQMVDPLVEDRYFIFCIGGAALVSAAIFGCVTAQNRKALPKRGKKAKKTESTETAVVAVEGQKTETK
ncbi:MAG: hypothetical protein IJA78_06235 [Clostridia bacterium]|nr:hypothetical protein [Clostridia bacterium]